MTKRLERGIFFLFLVLLIWIPIPLGSHLQWAWSIAEIWIAVIGLGIVLLYRDQLPWSHIAKFKWLLLPLGGFQLWVYLQTLVLPDAFIQWISPNASTAYQMSGSSEHSISLDRRMTLMALLRGSSYWLFLFSAIVLISSGRRLKIATLTLVISGTLQAFYGATMVLLNTKTSWVFGYTEVNVATGSFVYKNHFANYLMLCLSMGVGLIVTQLHVSRSGSWRVRIRRWLQGVLSPKMFIRLALIIMVIALVLTRSRMGNAAFFAATALVGLIALFTYSDKPRSLTVLILSVLVIDTLVIGTLFGLDNVKQRLIETSVVGESRDQVVFWSLDIIKDYPFTGTGMSTFYAVFPGYTQEYVGYYDYAHNDYIQFLVEAGIPATLLLVSMVLYALLLCFRTLKERQSRTMKGLALGSGITIVAMLIHIAVDFNLQPMANAVTFIFVLFVAVATSLLPAHDKKAFVSPFKVQRANAPR
jgi:O-antigen ligase